MLVKNVNNQTNCTKAEVIEFNTDFLNTNVPLNSVNKNYKLMKDLVKGNGLHTAVCAIPKFRSKRAENSKIVWKVLLDSGSDGNLLFIHPDNNEYIPSKVRFKPQWRCTSNGTFVTTKVGDLRNFALLKHCYLQMLLTVTQQDTAERMGRYISTTAKMADEITIV
jgi:hypothetical protein